MIMLNPRTLLATQNIRNMNMQKVVDLTQKMKRVGYNPAFPVRVIRVGDNFYIDDGHHRALSAIAAKVDFIPCSIVDAGHWVPDLDLSIQYDWEESIYYAENCLQKAC